MLSRGDIVTAAIQYYGTTAIPGGKSNPLVLGFFQRAGHPEIKDDDTPWCSAFLNAICAQIGAPKSGSLLASSWLSVGEPLATPQFGDIVVFDWTKIGGSGGHVGIVISAFNGLLYVLGGNQDNEVEIAAFKTRGVAGYRRIIPQ